MSDKWIDVKDRLPEYEIPVLVCAKGKDDSVYICRLASRLESKLNVSLSWQEGRLGYDEFFSDVTHWMPLPIVPKIDND